MPYATAKAAIEGLTRAAAIDYGKPEPGRTGRVILCHLAGSGGWSRHPAT